MSKILVIGETSLDQYIYVETVKINPECPSLVVRPIGEHQSEGMAANVYNNLVSLGISKNSISTIFPFVDIVKKRIVEKASDYTLLRIDEDDNVISKYKAKFKREDFDSYIDQIDIVVISSYNKGFLSTDDIEYIANKCHERGIKTLYDGKFILGGWSRNLFCVKINSSEYNDQLKAGIKPEDFCQNLVVTRGAQGIEYKGVIYPTIKVEKPSVCGAGDVILASLTYGLSRGYSLEDSIRFANKAASVAVRKIGTATVSMKEIEEMC